MKKIILGLVIVILLINGCVSPQSTKINENSLNIQINNFAFNPSETKIKKGETVTWTNLDDAAHTVTSQTGMELNSEALNKGEIFTHTFSQSGIYDYHCKFHPRMKGKIIVE